MEAVWRVEMLGTLRATRDDLVVTRFRTRRVTLLLAYLAVYRHRLHSREEVGEMLWPETDPEVVRRNLRQALFSLRHVLEPPPLPKGSILQVEQSRLRLNPELVATDLADFEAAIEAARRKGPSPEEIVLLEEAVGRYQGELLPGHYEDWILHERRRLDDLYLTALRRLVEHHRAAGKGDETIALLRRALDRDRLNEEWHVALIREYLHSDRPAIAIEQFGTLKEQLRKHLGCDPSETAYALLNKARRAVRAEARSVPEPLSPPPSELAEEPGEDAAGAAPEDEATPQIVRLPVQLTRFCGREEEIAQTLDHLLGRRARLTTLVGPAGTGKTRLSVEVGRRWAERQAGNVWFVPLADLTSASMIPDAILDTLKARRSAHPDPLDNLREAVRGSGSHLLILDNLEHILDEAVPMVGSVLERVPELQLLVTTRRLLNLAGEHQIPVSPLPVPSGQGAQESADREELLRLAEYASVQLFVDRCQTVRPDFQLTVHNARAVAAICAKLEGVPLALELAAGLSSAFAPGQMVYHLDKRLTALTSRKRDTPARHRSLAAAVAYSYETLSPELQSLFAALSVFRGGFTVEAAYEVCLRDRLPEGARAARRHPHDECLDLILELQERSLLRSEGAEENRELRFRMLESFREFGEERLSEAEARDLRWRHADYYRRSPAPPPYALSVEERTQRHLWIVSEFDNYLAALETFLAEEALEACVQILEILRTTWTSRGPRAVERNAIRRIAERLETTRIDPVAHIGLLRMLGTTHIRNSEYAAAYRACEAALEVARRSDLPGQITVCLSALATCAGFMGNLDECLALHEKILARVSEDDLPLLERAYLGSGAVYWGKGESERAEEAYRRAMEVSVRLHGGEPDTLILCNLAHVALDQSRFDEAMTRLGEAMRICRRVHDEFGLAICLSLVSRYHWLKGNLPAAIATGREALLKYRECDFHHFSLVGLFQQALILVDREEWAAATTLLAATQGMGRSARLPDERDHEAALEKIRPRLSPEAFERAWAKGLAMNTDEAFRMALRFE